MRICLYTATALPKLGGQEAVVDALARQFLHLGHEPVVLAPRPRRPLRADDRTLPYPVRRHPRFFSTRDFISCYRLFLTSAHARHHFDVIHCHDVYPTGYLAALCKPKLGVPLVITSHGGDVRENNPRLQKRGIPLRCVAALKAADALVSIGPFTEQGYRRLFPEAKNIATIPNGIDPAPYQARAPRPRTLDPAIREGRYLLFLGRLARRKGVDVLLDAVAKLSLNGAPQVVVAGAGDERPALESRTRQLGLQDRVHFIGRVEGTEKIYLLQNALCTVMPSRVWEAFPLVLMESYAAGRPVVGSAVPGIADLVDEGETGLLVPEEDSAALAQALHQLLVNPDQADRLGRSAHRVASAYSWESVARRHVSLYEQLATAHRWHGLPARDPASAAN